MKRRIFIAYFFLVGILALVATCMIMAISRLSNHTDSTCGYYLFTVYAQGFYTVLYIIVGVFQLLAFVLLLHTLNKYFEKSTLAAERKQIKLVFTVFTINIFLLVVILIVD